jgi:hypothetical protein
VIRQLARGLGLSLEHGKSSMHSRSLFVPPHVVLASGGPDGRELAFSPAEVGSAVHAVVARGLDFGSPRYKLSH